MVDPKYPASNATQSFSESRAEYREGIEFKLGESVGPFQLLRKLGEGGFGVVYHARQSEPLRRDVALKVIRPGLDNGQVLGRFDAERQTLAIMDHRCIAKILDAGSTSDGRPYFAMELVNGVPLTQFCDEKQMPIEQRMRLFIDVCRAIQHAHSKGVIHRDIKPSNILVTETDIGACPKVIDFGLAKAIQPVLQSEVHTAMHTMVGTPLYMSPEQAEMGSIDIDTRSDVYSLGVVLYQLLVGTSPYNLTEVSNASYFEICKLIREREVAPPSSRLAKTSRDLDERARCRGVDTRTLRKQVSGDLDWIVLKCLEKDRAKRYETANGLALDIERFLTNEPVTARRSSFTYSFGKLALRYKGQVLAALLTLAMLCAGLFSSLVLYSLAKARYAAAELNNQRARVLMDANTLTKLANEFSELRTIGFDRRREEMRHWLERAKKLATRLEIHQMALSQFPGGASNVDTNSVSESDRSIRQGLPFDFDDAADERTVRYLVDGIRALTAPGGTIHRVEEWERRSPSPDEIDGAWTVMLADLKSTGFTSPPTQTPFLFPIGKNPNTRLWEFVDLRLGLLPVTNSEDDGVSVEQGAIFVLLPGGSFSMGSPDDEEGRKPSEIVHSVTVSPFFISKYEVTREQWHAVMGITLSGRTGELWPASASYNQAMEFCQRMNYHLPTEAQWEYACRAGTTTPFAGSGNIDDMAWYIENSDLRPHRVGLKLPNAFGLFDMHGNMLEWCFDRFDDKFYLSEAATKVDPINAPTPPENEQEQRKVESCVLRGGPYDGYAKYCRSADRFHNLQDVASVNFGFRPVIDLAKPPPPPQPPPQPQP